MEKSKEKEIFNSSWFAANQDFAERYDKTEVEHEFRSKFERDRDRILYSKAFRRLSGKTQVFVTGYDDHIRTRLTHTLEVSQIAKTIVKRLKLNETLAEAIALGHDIGHTPFGHVGERTLNYITNGCIKIKNFNNDLGQNTRGFKHNCQGVRVVTELEKINNKNNGLNLTDFTIWGILFHSSVVWDKCKMKFGDDLCALDHEILKKCHNRIEKYPLSVDFYNKYNIYLNKDSWSIEAIIVNWADEIAQRHHDIEDGLEANIIGKEDLIHRFEKIFKDFLNDTDEQLIKEINRENDKKFYIPLFSKLIVNFYVSKFIKDVESKLKGITKELKISSSEDFYNAKSKIYKKYNVCKYIGYEDDFREKDKELQKYLRNRILNSHMAQTMDGRSSYIIRKLVEAYLSNPQQLPDKTILTFYRTYLSKDDMKKYDDIVEEQEKIGKLRERLKKDHYINNNIKYRTTLLRVVCDYISGMTDNYAISQFQMLYGVKQFINI